MKFYHGTTEESWKKIQEEGVLWGGDTYHRTGGKEGYRYTYLTPDLDVAENYGSKEVILEVEYEPFGVGNKVDGKTIDNYGFNPPQGQHCWQFSVFVPISIDKVKRKMNNIFQKRYKCL